MVECNDVGVWPRLNSFNDDWALFFVRYVSSPESMIGIRQKFSELCNTCSIIVTCVLHCTKHVAFWRWVMNHGHQTLNGPCSRHLSPQHRHSLECRRPQCHSTSYVCCCLTQRYIYHAGNNDQQHICLQASDQTHKKYNCLQLAWEKIWFYSSLFGSFVHLHSNVRGYNHVYYSLVILSFNRVQAQSHTNHTITTTCCSFIC